MRKLHLEADPEGLNQWWVQHLKRRCLPSYLPSLRRQAYLQADEDGLSRMQRQVHQGSGREGPCKLFPKQQDEPSHAPTRQRCIVCQLDG